VLRVRVVPALSVEGASEPGAPAPTSRVGEGVYRARPWRVHALAADFRLLDVWRLPLDADPDPTRGQTFDRFLRLFLANGVQADSALANALFRLRLVAGRVLGLDRPGRPPGIPGTDEPSIAVRLGPADRARDRTAALVLDVPALAAPVYVFEEEALFEIANRTVSALLHLGWVDAAARAGATARKTAELAVYVKPRGRLGAVYMALIGPFRHTFVYPPWLGRIGRLWREETSCAA
jgi:hypothetical protein